MNLLKDRKLLTLGCTLMCLFSLMFESVSVNADTLDKKKVTVPPQMVETQSAEFLLPTLVTTPTPISFVSNPIATATLSPVATPNINTKTQKAEKKYLYSEGYVKVRKKNSKKSSEKFLLKPGQKVEVLKETKTTAKVKTGKKVGYVVKKKLLADTKKQAVKTANKKAEKFRITGYCPCKECSEGWGNHTKSGKRAKANHTVAADLSVLPLNTEVYIEGLGKRTVEDIGGGVKGKHIDVYVNKHHQCSDVTTSNTKVFEVEG